MPSAKYHVNANEGSLTNTKWVIIAITAIITAIIVGGCIAAAIILTGTDDENGTSGRDLTTVALSSSSVHTTPISNSESTGTSTTDTTRASSSTPATLDVTSTDSTTTGGPSVATWLPWNDWLPCSVTCGVGIHRRYRSCKDGAFTCVGDYIENAVCTATPCPVYGKWTTWESWGSCSSSCGGGVQLRTRSCNTTDPSDLDCVGNDTQNKTCSNWNCPDCSQKCTHGILNAACDTCICESNNVTGQVVSNKTGIFIGNAFVFASTAPTTLLTQTNTTGYFTVNTTCISTELLIVKDGYVDAIVTIESSNIKVPMVKIALPYFTQTPRPKYRLAGETVTMCCTAMATPGIDYYEWFKDSLLIETLESTNDTMIILNDVVPADSGFYQCRANSRYGTIMSPVARLDVKDNPDDFCANALQPKFVSLPDGCVDPYTNSKVYDVGECFAHSCRLNKSNHDGSCDHETYSCCAMSESDMRTVQCIDYEVQLFVVRTCKCFECIPHTLKISGTVVDFEDDSPVTYAEVWVNGVFQAYTSGLGSFYFEPSKSVDQVNVYIVDNFRQQYLSTTKVFQIFPDMAGTLHIDIKLFKASDPVDLDSAVTNTLVAGTSEKGSAIVEVEIPSNAFYKVDGTPYNGTVLASLTFLDPTDIAQLENIPGLFEFTDAEGQQGALDTYGVFNLHFSDADNQPLALGATVDLYAPNGVGTGHDYEEIKLWKLNTEVGNWEYMPSGSGSGERRKKRQTQGNFIGTIDSAEPTETWNYDKVRTKSNACYFKLRFFQDRTLNTPVTDLTSSIRVHTTTLINDSTRLIFEDIRSIWHNCISVLCENTTANITVFDYRTKYKKYLYAAEPFTNIDHPDINFTITDRTILKAKMIRSPNGPFFESLDVCKMSVNNDAHLRWYFENEDWEVMKLYPKLSGSPTPRYIEMRKRTWYPYHDSEGYRACYVKVRLKFGKLNILDSNLKLTALSIGGNNGPVHGKLFGGRVVNVQDTNNTTICIEFKCSGPIDGTIDNTKVQVELFYPKEKMNCTTKGADGLSKYEGNYGLYVFSAPTEGVTSGIYYATRKEKESLDDAKESANTKCHSGSSVETTAAPLKNVGINFTCLPN